MITEPDIFQYLDYRKYLQDLFLFKKQEHACFSHRYIIQKAGFKSPNYLKNIIDGRRNLSLEGANKFAGAFKLEGSFRHYFLTLVLFNQTKLLEERERYLRELKELQGREAAGHLGEEQYEVLSKWWHLVIKEMVELPDFKNSSKWVGRNLLPTVDPKEVQQSLVLMKRLGLIAKKGGKWHAKDKILETDPLVKSIHAAEFHRQMIALGSQSINRVSAEGRLISGTTLRISKADVERFKCLIRDFRKQALALAAESNPAEQVYQFNVQFFPVVQPNRKVRSDKAQSETEDL